MVMDVFFFFCCVRVATVAAIGLGETYSHRFSTGVVGRVVTLVIPGPGRYLTLCEVEVYGYPAPTGQNTRIAFRWFPVAMRDTDFFTNMPILSNS